MAVDFNNLTSKQKKVYLAIESFIKERGIPPTVREIGEMVGEKTPGAVQGILNRLEQKGVIKRELGMARSIQLVSNNSFYVDHSYIPEIKKITARNVNDLLNIYNIVAYHPVSKTFVPSGDNCFIMKWDDDSLSESDIKRGDFLVFNRSFESLEDGSVVLAMYDGRAYLRRFAKTSDKGVIRLEADFNVLDKELFDEKEVTILGRLVGKYTVY